MLKPQMQSPLCFENRGWPEAVPFDAIIATRAQDEIQEHLIDPLKEGGCLIGLSHGLQYHGLVVD